MDAREYRRRVPRPSPRFSGEKPRRMRQQGWPANGRKPSRELTCVACRLVDVREGTRVSNEGRLEACRLARCRQPRARGAQRSGFRTWRRRVKTKIPGKNLTEWRLASNQRSSFSVFKNQRRRFTEPCFPGLFVLLLEIPRGHETALQKTIRAHPSPHTHARLVLNYVPLTAFTHHPGSANPESTPTPPAGSDPCRRSRGNLGESRT